MLIEYVLTGGRREVSEAAARRLIRVKLARPVQARVIERAAEQIAVRAEEVETVEISPRTGKPKRAYKRRDVRAE